MRAGVANHGGSWRPAATKSAAKKSFAVFVAAAATLAQFFALSHEITVRHVRCAEHGELTHLATTAATSPVAAPSAESSIAGADVTAEQAHEHCGALFTLQGGEHAPARLPALRYAPPVQTAPAPPAIVCGPAWVAILASAPKTSPPSA